MLVEEGGSIGGVDSDYGSAGRESTVNPDFSTAAPNVISLLANLRTTRQEMYNLWQNRKQRLDQCFQLKLFEQDADKVRLDTVYVSYCILKLEWCKQFAP